MRSLALRNGVVYAAGDFHSIGGQSRFGVAALDSVTGLATSWDPNCDDFVHEVVPVDGVVYLGGEFLTVGGQPRRGVAAVDASDAQPTGWHPVLDGPVTTLAVAERRDLVYFGGFISRVDSLPHQYAAVVDSGTGSVRTWDPRLNYPPLAMIEHASTLYLGDPAGLSVFRGSTVLAVGDPIETLDRSILAARPNPMRSAGRLAFELPRAGAVTLDLVDVAGRRVRRLLDGASMSAGHHEVRLDRDGLRAGLYFARLAFGGRHFDRKIAIVD